MGSRVILGKAIKTCFMKYSVFLFIYGLMISSVMSQGEMVIDLRPGSSGSSISNLTVVNDKLFFSAKNDTGHFLFVSDGTAEGTMSLYEFPQFQNVFQFDAFYDRLVFFRASSGSTPTQIYTSDGTSGGTHLLISEDLPNQSRLFIPVTDDHYYFQAGSQPKFYRYDPVKDSTELVTGPQFPNGISINLLFTFIGRGHEAWFVGHTSEVGHELMFTDGTLEGTVLVADLNPGSASSWPHNISVFDDEVYFTASLTHPERGLYRYDRTTQTVHLVKIIQEGVNAFHGFSTGTFMYRLPNGIVLFIADDGIHGTELWRTDGTPEGTYMVKDIREGPFGSMGDSSWGGDYFFPVGDQVLFGANDGVHGTEWWITDGTSQGTQLVIDLREGSSSGISLISSILVVADGKVYFRGRTATQGYEVWETDGTAQGTRQISNVRPGPESGDIQMLVKMGNYLFFRGDDGVHGSELWKLSLDETTGIENQIPQYKENTLVIFPNPASGWITVQHTGVKPAEVIEISDLKGTRIMHHYLDRTENEATLNVNHLLPGIYLVRWGSDVKKLLIK
jgi:ELWxxDGT repeat protein